MARLDQLVVTLPHNRRADAQVRHFVVPTDQPVDNGGDDSAPTPYETFLASIGACVGVTVQGFCAKRGLAFEGIRVVQRNHFGDDGILAGADIDVELPPDFPEKYREAVLRVAGQCSVKRAIAAQPRFEVRAVERGASPTEAAHPEAHPAAHTP